MLLVDIAGRIWSPKRERAELLRMPPAPCSAQTPVTAPTSVAGGYKFAVEGSPTIEDVLALTLRGDEPCSSRNARRVAYYSS